MLATGKKRRGGSDAEGHFETHFENNPFYSFLLLNRNEVHYFVLHLLSNAFSILKTKFFSL